LRVFNGELGKRVHHGGEAYTVGEIITGLGSTRASRSSACCSTRDAEPGAPVSGDRRFSNPAGFPAHRYEDMEAEFLS
jgi:hypothetical protein